MIDLRRLEILRELARCGTIAATAGSVHLTPSAVSQQMAALSREAGTPMLEPDGRRVRLTAAAELLLNHAHEVFTHLEHAESDLAAFRNGDAGTVRLGAFSSSMRGIAVPTVTALAKRTRLRVQVREVQPEDAADALLSRAVDIALTLTAESAVLGADDPRLENRHLVDDIMDIALPRGHPLAEHPEVDLAALAGADWVLSLPGVPCWTIAIAACARAGFTPNVRHYIDDFTGAVALIGAGAGVGLLPRLAQGAFGAEPIEVRPLAGPPVARRIEVQYRAGTANQPHIAPVLAQLALVCGADRRDGQPGTRPSRLPLTAPGCTAAMAERGPER